MRSMPCTTILLQGWNAVNAQTSLQCLESSVLSNTDHVLATCLVGNEQMTGSLHNS